jgi:hypothetical protein
MASALSFGHVNAGFQPFELHETLRAFMHALCGICKKVVACGVE